jgi:hypothetical protein
MKNFDVIFLEGFLDRINKINRIGTNGNLDRKNMRDMNEH